MKTLPILLVSAAAAGAAEREECVLADFEDSVLRAGDEWVRVVLNELPQHQRDEDGVPADNPTLPAGDYGDLLTRFYIAPLPYFADPEIPYPVRMWVDDVKLVHVQRRSPATERIGEYRCGEVVKVPVGDSPSIPVELASGSGGPLEGFVARTFQTTGVRAAVGLTSGRWCGLGRFSRLGVAYGAAGRYCVGAGGVPRSGKDGWARAGGCR